MSSCGNPTAESDSLMTRRSKFDRSKGCIKCKAPTGNIVIRHAVYCKECFFPLVNTKFRKSLQPSINEKSDGNRQKSLKASGNLLIGLSGGLGSTVLVDLAAKNYFMKSESSKGGNHHPRKLNDKVWSQGYVCYVEMRNRVEDIRTIVDKYACFEFVPVYLEDAFDPTWWEKVGGGTPSQMLGLDLGTENAIHGLSPISLPSSAYSNPSSRLKAYLSSMPTQTALLTSVQTLIRVLLLYTAMQTSSSHLLLGTSLTSLSISLISTIAQGGGFAVPEEVQEEWSSEIVKVGNARSDKIRVNRPLRDVGMKECSAWAWWNGLHVVGQEPIPNAKQGIGSLTKDFIIGLETDYPSTVSTIARTCAKLAPKERSTGICLLCQRPAPFDVLQWKSRISILHLTDNHDNFSEDDLASRLCYGCHTALTSRSSRGMAFSSKKANGDDLPTPLPIWVQVTSDSKDVAKPSDFNTPIVVEEEIMTSRLMSSKEMKESIGSFLLEDE